MTLDGTIQAERRRLLAFIRSRVGQSEDAEDIVQDVLYQLVEADGLVEPIEKLTSWLFTVARNRIIDLYRKRKPDSFSSLQPLGEEESAPVLLEDTLFDPADSPEEIYFRTLFREALADALEELPTAQREVFVMHELEGKSFREISAETGVSVATLLSRKRYAVASLREELQELYDELNR